MSDLELLTRQLQQQKADFFVQANERDYMLGHSSSASSVLRARSKKMKSAAATRNSVVPGKSKKLGSGTRKRFSHKQQFDQTTSLSTSLSTASLFTSYTYPSSSSPSQSIGNSGIKARGPRPRGPPRKPSSTSSSSSSSPSLSAQGKQRSSFPRNAGQANDLGANHVDKDSSNKAWASFEFPFSSLQLHQEEETTTSYTHRIGALRGSGYQPHNANASAGMLSAGGSADGVGAGGSRKKKQRPTTAGPRRSLPSKSRDDRSPVSFSSSPSSLSRPASSSFSCGRRKDKGALGTSVSTGNITLGSKVRTRPSSSYASFSSSPGSPHMASSHSAATLVRERPVSSYAKLSAVADRHSYDSRDGDIGDGNNSVGNESVLVETHCSDETRHALGHTQAQKIDTDVNYRDLLKEKRGFGSDNHFDDRGNLANVNNDESDEHLNVSSAAVKSNVQKPDPRQRKKIRPMSASAVRVNTRHEDTGREHVNNFLHQDSSNNAKRTTGTAVRARKKVIRPSSSYASSSPSTSLSSASPSISTSTSLNFCYFKDIDGSNDVGSGDASSTYRSTARSLHSVHESSNLEQILSSSPSSSSFGTSQGGSKVNAKTNPVLGSKKTKASEGGNRKGKERGKKRGKKKDLTLADIAKAKQSVSSSLSLPSTSSGAGPRFRSVVVELEIKLAEKLQMIRGDSSQAEEDTMHVYSSVFEEVIENDAVFSSLLARIKAFYDSYGRGDRSRQLLEEKLCDENKRLHDRLAGYQKQYQVAFEESTQYSIQNKLLENTLVERETELQRVKKRVKQLQASLARSRPHAGDASMGADLSLENEDVDEDTQDQAQDVQDFDHIDSTSDGIEVPEKTSRGEGKRRVVGRAKRNSIADNPMLGKLLAGYDSTNHRHSVDGTRDGNDENVAVSSDGKKTGEEELEGARERAFVKDRLQFKQLKDLGLQALREKERWQQKHEKLHTNSRTQVSSLQKKISLLKHNLVQLQTNVEVHKAREVAALATVQELKMKQAHATNSATTTNTANSYIQGINHCSDTDLGSKAPEAAGNAGTQTSSSDGSGVSVDVIDMCRELETHSLRSIDDESSDGDGEGDNDDEAVLMKQLADLQKSMQEIRSKLDSKKRSTLSLGVAGSENEDCSEDDEELDSSFSSYLSSEASSLSSSPVASPAQSSCSLSPSSSPLSNVAGARLKTAFLSARSRITSQQKPEQGRETQTFPSSLYNVPTDQNGQMVMSSLNSSRPFLLLPKTPKPRSNRVHIPVLDISAAKALAKKEEEEEEAEEEKQKMEHEEQLYSADPRLGCPPNPFAYAEPFAEGYAQPSGYPSYPCPPPPPFMPPPLPGMQVGSPEYTEYVQYQHFLQYQHFTKQQKHLQNHYLHVTEKDHTLGGDTSQASIRTDKYSDEGDKKAADRTGQEAKRGEQFVPLMSNYAVYPAPAHPPHLQQHPHYHLHSSSWASHPAATALPGTEQQEAVGSERISYSNYSSLIQNTSPASNPTFKLKTLKKQSETESLHRQKSPVTGVQRRKAVKGAKTKKVKRKKEKRAAKKRSEKKIRETSNVDTAAGSDDGDVNSEETSIVHVNGPPQHVLSQSPLPLPLPFTQPYYLDPHYNGSNSTDIRQNQNEEEEDEDEEGSARQNQPLDDVLSYPYSQACAKSPGQDGGEHATEPSVDIRPGTTCGDSSELLDNIGTNNAAVGNAADQMDGEVNMDGEEEAGMADELSAMRAFLEGLGLNVNAMSEQELDEAAEHYFIYQQQQDRLRNIEHMQHVQFQQYQEYQYHQQQLQYHKNQREQQ